MEQSKPKLTQRLGTWLKNKGAHFYFKCFLDIAAKRLAKKFGTTLETLNMKDSQSGMPMRKYSFMHPNTRRTCNITVGLEAPLCHAEVLEQDGFPLTAVHGTAEIKIHQMLSLTRGDIPSLDAF